MRKRATISCLAILLFTSSKVMGESVVEIVQPQGLLLLGDIRQWASFGYDYSGHTSSGGTTSGASSHHFNANYHVGTGAAILDPHLLNVELDGEIGLDQRRDSDQANNSHSSGGVDFLYSVT